MSTITTADGVQINYDRRGRERSMHMATGNELAHRHIPFNRARAA
jgi:hypothetical protein